MSNVSVSDCGSSVALLYGWNPRFKAVNSVFEHCGSFDNEGLGGVVTVDTDPALSWLRVRVEDVDRDFSAFARGSAVVFENCTLRHNRAERAQVGFGSLSRRLRCR